MEETQSGHRLSGRTGAHTDCTADQRRLTEAHRRLIHRHVPNAACVAPPDEETVRQHRVWRREKGQKDLGLTISITLVH